MEGVLLAKGGTYKQPMYAYVSVDIQRHSLKSRLFFRNMHRLIHIHLILALVPIEYFIRMYELERAPKLGRADP